MKFHLAAMTIIWFAAFVTGASSAQTIKLATLAPKDSPWYDALRDMAESWHQVSNGSVTVRIYADGVAGDESEVVRKMRIGQLQAGAISGGGLPDIAPEIRVLQMPMMYRSFAEMDFVRARIQPKLNQAFAAKGFRILGWGDAGWLYFFTAKPVIHPDDLKPLKLFSWAGNTTFLKIWKDLGYQPVPLAATEIHLGLASGLIDAMAVPALGALTSQWFALVPHMTDVKFAPLVGAVVVTERAWSSIPQQIRPHLREAAVAVEGRFREIRNLDREAIAVMQKHGLEVHQVQPDMIELWERRARLAYPGLVGSVIPEDLAGDVERLRDAYRADHGQ